MANVVYKLDWFDFTQGYADASVSNIWGVQLVHITDDLRVVDVSGEPGSNCLILASMEQYKGIGGGFIIRRYIVTDGTRWYPVVNMGGSLYLPKDANEIREIAHIKRLDPSLDFPLSKRDLRSIRRAVRHLRSNVLSPPSNP